ncbi:cell wall-associated hydrolase, invasion-associated protein [Desulfosporosinus acidiphilus SJ4]|uniref:Cell wall-associated hydrolase, invasion-associated protein n=1 Tax=Desulfosporosinus acidiphilus (strain DSM 22704 / JCM 16185 / SJ4) TaxID=646529 RepID=I4D6E0_DESAJ|nr:C40 family peptidase [Desulfosporosinus acidiphilus]AFM41364.1 cell wall-associated hydrolase, invasion-associated protein [Desulfosporosinus acidiphilus SJ4]
MMKRIITLTITVLIGILAMVPVANASTNTARAAKVQRVIAKSESFIGTRYVLGGTSYYGIDCSGLTMDAYKVAGIALPRTSSGQYNVGTYVTTGRLLLGDLVFFSFNARHTITHVGIYLGNGKFINATSHKGVTISRFSPYWWKAYVGAKRIIR